ncbi:MAG TPA: response regulator [Herpetosiphonaceae bacterium]|nr:response regulator [Herpetosiphonaceae bacterium]
MSFHENTGVSDGYMEETRRRDRLIMVVDDESSIRSAIADILEDEGYEVVVVRNGKEAMNYLHANSPLPCLILLDLIMPEVSGVEFLNRQHSEPMLAEIPVIAMSGDFYLAQQTPVLGVADYLLKPFDVDELLTTVTRVCA